MSEKTNRIIARLNRTRNDVMSLQLRCFFPTKKNQIIWKEINKIIPDEKDPKRKCKKGKGKIVKKAGIECVNKAANEENDATKLKYKVKEISSEKRSREGRKY